MKAGGGGGEEVMEGCPEDLLEVVEFVGVGVGGSGRLEGFEGGEDEGGGAKGVVEPVVGEVEGKVGVLVGVGCALVADGGAEVGGGEPLVFGAVVDDDGCGAAAETVGRRCLEADMEGEGGALADKGDLGVVDLDAWGVDEGETAGEGRVGQLDGETFHDFADQEFPPLQGDAVGGLDFAAYLAEVAYEGGGEGEFVATTLLGGSLWVARFSRVDAREICTVISSTVADDVAFAADEFGLGCLECHTLLFFARQR